MSDPFIRTRMLVGDEPLSHLAAARVAVFGVGGVGGFCVEALARAGVKVQLEEVAGTFHGFSVFCGVAGGVWMRSAAAA